MADKSYDKVERRWHGGYDCRDYHYQYTFYSTRKGNVYARSIEDKEIRDWLRNNLKSIGVREKRYRSLYWYRYWEKYRQAIVFVRLEDAVAFKLWYW